jgi:uncharacterized protein CbrC (UPF0167 family)
MKSPIERPASAAGSRSDGGSAVAYGDAAVEVIRRESGFENEEWSGYFDALDKNHGPTAYIFRCRHCGKLGGYSDSH